MTLSTNNVPISLHNGLTPHLLSKETAQNLMVELFQHELADICNHPDFQKGLEELKARGMVIPNTVIPFVNRIKGQPAVWVNVEGLGLWRIKSSDELNEILDKYLQRCFAQTPINPPTLQETASKTDRIHDETESLDEVEETDSPTLTDRTITDTKPTSKDKRTRKDKEKDLKRTCEECERLRRDGVKLNDERIAELEKEKEELQEEIDDLKEKLKSAPNEKEIKRLERRIVYLERCLEKRQKAIRGLQEANRKLKRENRQLRLDNRTLQQRLARALQDQSDLQTINNFLRQQLRYLHEVEGKLLDSNAQVRRLEAALADARRHAPPVDDHIGLGARPDDDAHDRIADLEARLAEGRAAYDSLMNDLLRAEEALEHISERAEELDLSSQELAKQVEALQARIAQLRDLLEYARGPEREEALKALEADLTAKIEELQHRLAELERDKNAEIDALRAEIATLRKTNSEQELEIIGLRLSAQKALAQKDLLLEFVREVHALKDVASSERTPKLDTLVEQLTAFEGEAPQLVAYVKGLKQANEELQAQLSDARGKAAEAQKTLREKQEAFEKASSDLQSALAEAALKKDSEAAEFRRQIAELKTALLQSEAEKSQLSTTVDGLRAENLAQAAELASAKAKAEAAEKAHRELVEVLKKLRELPKTPDPTTSRVTELQVQFNALADKIPELTAYAKRLKEANKALRAQLKAASGTGTEAQEALKAAQEEFNNARNALQAALDKVASAKESEAEEFRRQIAELKAALTLKTDELSRSEAEKRQLSTTVDGLRAENLAQATELASAKAKAEAAEKAHSELVEALKQLHAFKTIPLPDLTSTINALFEKLAALEKSFPGLKTKIAQLTEANKALRAQLKAASGTGTDAQEALKAAKEEFNKAKEELQAALAQAAREKASEIEAFRKRIGELELELEEERRKNKDLQASLDAERAELQKLKDQLSLLPAAGAGTGNQKELEELRAEVAQLLETLEKMTGEKIDDGRVSPSLADEEDDASIDATRRNLRLIIEHFKKLVQDLEESRAREAQTKLESGSKKPQEKEQTHCDLHEQQIRLLGEQIAILHEKLQMQALSKDEDVQVANAKAQYSALQYQEKAKEAAAAEERLRSAEARLRIFEQRQEEEAAKANEAIAQLGSAKAMLEHDRSTLERELAESRKHELALQRTLEEQAKTSAADREALSTRTKDDKELRALMGAGPSDTLLTAYRRNALAQKSDKAQLQDQLEESQQRAKEDAEQIIVPDPYWQARVERYEQQQKELEAAIEIREKRIAELEAEVSDQTGLLELGVQAGMKAQEQAQAQEGEIARLGEELNRWRGIKMQRRPSVPIALDRATA